MNAVEIEEAVSALAEQPFDAQEFAYAFLEAFGNKPTTIKRLRKGTSNKSDLGGVLQTNNIHILVCQEGEVSNTLVALKASPATAKAKAKLILATDGVDFEAEDLISGETVACAYRDFPDHFGFFLPLAGITTVKQIRESAFDIKATGRLNKLYVELLRTNPDWGTAERRHDMNHFMARLIFCFFAEDTDIFNGDNLFTATIEQMSARDSSNTHEVIGELFRAMNTRTEGRANAKLPRWTDQFPYVNGGLFAEGTDAPRFTRIARSYLLHIGNLDWKKINPDIFGSMIQAVADDEERGALGMHYTSVPNILKVLNPLFLDDLRVKLEQAGGNPRKLLNLRNRMTKIRVFDPACGSGNFLVIAYKEMRAIEAEINKGRGEADRRTDIPLTNFRGIELRDFPAEIARLALIIAEYQCDVLYRGQKEALAEFLPLDAMNWITCGNALRLDWLGICPSTGTGVKHHADDLFHTPLDQAQIDFENEGGETFICGNPPYVWSNDQSSKQKSELEVIFSPYTKSWKSLNYVSGWFARAAEYANHTKCQSAFVSINTICQGQSVGTLWPIIFDLGREIKFAHTSFKWSNLASNNAGVTVVIVGLSDPGSGKKTVYLQDETGSVSAKTAAHINAYLIDGADVLVKKSNQSLSDLPEMKFGNKPVDGGHLLLLRDELEELGLDRKDREKLTKRIIGAAELVSGTERYCLWIEDKNLEIASQHKRIRERIERVRKSRFSSRDKGANGLAERAHQFREMNIGMFSTIVIPAVSSEGREYLPIQLVSNDTVISNRCYGIFDAPLFNFALLSSRVHLVWIATVCGRLELRFSYTSTLGWNTFPVPRLTEKNKVDLTHCAEDILLAREAHFPATIADLYDPEMMPEDLRMAHERNDEVLERIYIGRRFRNDTERLEKLFELYTIMTTAKDLRETNSSMKAQPMSREISVPSISVTYAQNGGSTKSNELGMRPMQERAYAKRGEQYLLIKSPPASGKSRALMFIALDKLHNQGLKQVIIVVPEKSIGASFHDEPLSKFGFWADWQVTPKWNLCNAPGSEGGKVNSVGTFLESDEQVLVCTHATFRFAVDKFGVEVFNDRLIAVDEFHHVSANPDNKLGAHLGKFIARDRVHIVAMTGSYFRGDAEPVLMPHDEARFDTVTYTYYEQLNGYKYLKQLDIGYFFYSGAYADDILKVLDPNEKTIIHIPSVNSRESTKDKHREVEHIIDELGDWQGTDKLTGFQLVKAPDGRVIRIADLVDDDPAKRDRVSAALKDPTQKNNRDHVDIIIALGMAKEGFDWLWCEHALTVGYRASLTEVVQIIGRATRDAPGKSRARFTNLIAEPDASEEAVTEAVNDTLKAIAASLLMEQVLAPRFNFTPKNPNSGPISDFDYGDGGYDPDKCNVGFNEESGQFQIEIKGLAEPKSKEAERICQEDLNEVITAFVQDKTALERGMFDEELVPEELTQVRMGKIIKDRYPELDEEDQEAVRQHAIAALNLTQKAKEVVLEEAEAEKRANTALIDGVRRFALEVTELDIDLIDRINPFGEAYAILAKTMSEESLKQVATVISAKKVQLTPEDARDLAKRALKFKQERGRLPSVTSPDAWEKRMAEGVAFLARMKAEAAIG